MSFTPNIPFIISDKVMKQLKDIKNFTFFFIIFYSRTNS